MEMQFKKQMFGFGSLAKYPRCTSKCRTGKLNYMQYNTSEVQNKEINSAEISKFHKNLKHSWYRRVHCSFI